MCVCVSRKSSRLPSPFVFDILLSIGFALLGDANTFRYNYVSGGSGAGLAVGGVDHDSEDHEYGVFNQVRTMVLRAPKAFLVTEGAVFCLFCSLCVSLGVDGAF